MRTNILLVIVIILGSLLLVHKTTEDIKNTEKRDTCVPLNEEMLLCEKWGKTPLSNIIVKDIFNGAVVVEKQ